MLEFSFNIPPNTEADEIHNILSVIINNDI